MNEDIQSSQAVLLSISYPKCIILNQEKIIQWDVVKIIIRYRHFETYEVVLICMQKGKHLIVVVK